MNKHAIILCSGGIDSVTTAIYVKERLKYKKLKIIFFNYGQKGIAKEREFSKKCSKKLKCEFMEIRLDFLKNISNSLINKKGKINPLVKLKNTKKESEKFYVPCRNNIFLIYALAIAESIYLKEKVIYDIFVGFKCEGKEAYPDTTKEYVGVINRLSKISCNGKFRIFSPLIEKDKEDIIKLGKEIGVDLKKTFSCYIGKNKHCGECLSCRLRKAGFYWANESDPTEYINKS